MSVWEVGNCPQSNAESARKLAASLLSRLQTFCVHGKRLRLRIHNVVQRIYNAQYVYIRPEPAASAGFESREKAEPTTVIGERMSRDLKQRRQRLN